MKWMKRRCPWSEDFILHSNPQKDWNNICNYFARIWPVYLTFLGVIIMEDLQSLPVSWGKPLVLSAHHSRWWKVPCLRAGTLWGKSAWGRLGHDVPPLPLPLSYREVKPSEQRPNQLSQLSWGTFSICWRLIGFICPRHFQATSDPNPFRPVPMAVPSNMATTWEDAPGLPKGYLERCYLHICRQNRIVAGIVDSWCAHLSLHLGFLCTRGDGLRDTILGGSSVWNWVHRVHRVHQFNAVSCADGISESWGTLTQWLGRSQAQCLTVQCTIFRQCRRTTVRYALAEEEARTLEQLGSVGPVDSNLNISELYCYVLLMRVLVEVQLWSLAPGVKKLGRFLRAPVHQFREHENVGCGGLPDVWVLAVVWSHS